MTVSDWIAIYGAVVSTGVALWTFWISKPKLRVDWIYGVEPQRGNGFYVTVRNLSAHDAHIQAFSMMYECSKPSLWERLRHMWIYKSLPLRLGWCSSALGPFAVQHDFPLTLGGRKAHDIFVSEAQFNEMLKAAPLGRLRAHIQDQLWTNYYSAPFTSQIRLTILRETSDRNESP